MVWRQSHPNDMSMKINEMIDFVEFISDCLVIQPIGLGSQRPGILHLSLSVALRYAFLDRWSWVQAPRETHWLDSLKTHLVGCVRFRTGGEN